MLCTWLFICGSSYRGRVYSLLDLTTELETWVYFCQGVVTSQIHGHIIVGKSEQGIIEFVTCNACRRYQLQQIAPFSRCSLASFIRTHSILPEESLSGQENYIYSFISVPTSSNWNHFEHHVTLPCAGINCSILCSYALKNTCYLLDDSWAAVSVLHTDKLEAALHWKFATQ